jgi:hypothetical protein
MHGTGCSAILLVVLDWLVKVPRQARSCRVFDLEPPYSRNAPNEAT